MLSRFFTPLVFLSILTGMAPAQPLIVENPVSVSAYPGDLVTLKASASSSAPLTYQWRKDGAVMAGEVQPSLTLTATLTPPATTSSALYTLQISDGVATVTTTPAAVFVIRRPQAISFSAPTTAASASSVTLEAAASSGLPVSFAIASGAGSLAGRILTGNGGPVVVRATQTGNGTFEPATAVDRTIDFISVAITPFLTTVPSDQTLLAGAPVTLRAVSIGTPAPTYQWTKNGTAIPGATGATLTFAAVSLEDAARYTLTATNIAGSSTASAELVVRAAPVVVTPPATQTVIAGRSVTLSAVVTGFPAPTVQWRKDGRAIAGATRAELTLSGVTSAAAGNYDVVATNALGSATSAAAILTVTLRDFSGTYRGTLGSGAGEIALLVRRNGPATVLAHLTAAAAGLSSPAVAVDLNGNFSATVPLLSATARNVTLRGAIDETAGTINGSIAELNLTFTASRAEPASPVPAQAGLYFGGVIGGATAASVLVGPDGRAFALLLNGPAVDSAAGSLSADGR
ncbi:MAG: immunoglobulin domain-containing protein, partial [Opitutaceae bacterium]